MTDEMKTDTTAGSAPLVTFVLFSFNQEIFIRDAIAAAFAQTYSPLQIILTDDCSSDATFAIMEEMANQYTGPHQIILNRNKTNLGIGNHINQFMELAEGEWIVVAAGDDISTPNRTAEIMTVARRSDIKPYSIWSRAQHMSSDGELMDVYECSTGEQYSASEMVSNKRVVMGCSHAWHRDVFRVFGPLYHKVIFEDNAISFRSFLLGDIGYVDETLVYYRQHDKNVTNYLKSISKEELARKMYRRRRYAIVGVYQRLLDVITYQEAGPDRAGRADQLNKSLMRQLFKQNLNMNLARNFPVLEGTRKLIRRFF
jgi:glycosyltransferase involved in cell wall biosynthesis